MPTWSTIAAFAVASLVLVAIPGPSVLYIVGRGASQGPLAGFVSAAGIQTGSLVHVAAAAAGLSALITASATAFTVVKVLGGGYLIYLGVKALRGAGAHAVNRPSTPQHTLRRVYRDGIVVNALNPKTAVFFLAFLPQFVDPARGAVTPQLLLLGGVFIAVGLCSDGTYGIVSGVLGDAVRRRRAVARQAASSSSRGSRATGALYIALGTVTLATGNHS